MKKILMFIVFAMMLIFSQNNVTHAQDVWVYTDVMDGKYYVMDDTFEEVYMEARAFKVNVKYIDVVMEEPKVHIWTYTLSYGPDGLTSFRDGKLKKTTAVEQAIWDYGLTRRDCW